MFAAPSCECTRLMSLSLLYRFLKNPPAFFKHACWWAKLGEQTKCLALCWKYWGKMIPYLFCCCGEINELLPVIVLIFIFSYHHSTPTIFTSFCAHIFVAFLRSLTKTFLILSSWFLSTLILVGTDPQRKAFHRWRLPLEKIWLDREKTWKRIKRSPFLNFWKDAPPNLKQKMNVAEPYATFLL